jgi:hypothetical protein
MISLSVIALNLDNEAYNKQYFSECILRYYIAITDKQTFLKYKYSKYNLFLLLRNGKGSTKF